MPSRTLIGAACAAALLFAPLHSATILNASAAQSSNPDLTACMALPEGERAACIVLWAANANGEGRAPAVADVARHFVQQCGGDVERELGICVGEQAQMLTALSVPPELFNAALKVIVDCGLEEGPAFAQCTTDRATEVSEEASPPAPTEP